jgi:predicted transcriptional regulator
LEEKVHSLVSKTSSGKAMNNRNKAKEEHTQTKQFINTDRILAKGAAKNFSDLKRKRKRHNSRRLQGDMHRGE